MSSPGSVLVDQPPPGPAPAPLPGSPGPGALLAAEALRFWSRRLFRVQLVLGAAGYLAGLLLASTQYAKPSAASLADATARRQQMLVSRSGTGRTAWPASAARRARRPPTSAGRN